MMSAVLGAGAVVVEVVVASVLESSVVDLGAAEKRRHITVFTTVSKNYLHPPTCLATRSVTSFLGTCYTYLEEEIARTVQTLNVSCIKKR